MHVLQNGRFWDDITSLTHERIMRDLHKILTAIYRLVSEQGRWNISFYTTFTNFSIKYLVMWKVYTDLGCIK